MPNYTVFFKKENYNPFRTYYQNQNRYADSKSFVDENEARQFCKKVNGRLYYLGKKIF